MLTTKQAHVSAALAALLLVGGATLSECSHSDSPPPMDKVGPSIPRNSRLGWEIDRLNNEIFRAQLIEQHASHQGLPDQPITSAFGTDSLHREYHYANLRAFRLDIKRRIDSLKSAGVVPAYDTTSEGPVQHGKLRIDPNPSAATE